MNIAFAHERADRSAPFPSSPDLITIDDLSVSYGCRTALKDVSLNVPAGGITALIGPSGCGKSSLLLALNRMTDLVPGCRLSGSVTAFGEDTLGADVDVTRLRRRIGMVFQRPNPFPFSIRRNFELVLDEAGIRSPEARAAKIRECLSAVGLLDEVGDRLDRPATTLSGGQQQRLCIARALVTSPEVLLLDEPCSALDPISTMTIERLLLGLKESVCIVMVTHNLAQARRVADRCAVFWADGGCGYLLEEGPKERVFDEPRYQLTRDYVSGSVA